MAVLAIARRADDAGPLLERAPGGRLAGGWPRTQPERAGLRSIVANRRLLVLAVALALFNLGNGGMLSLLGQKLVATAADATSWTARYVMVAQLVMVPVALFAGSLADRRGRRQLLLAACAVLPVRAALSAFIDDPLWLISAEILDGVASGIIGVAVPVVVADLTWGSGRTQTALGTVNAIQGIGGALSAWYGGLAQALLGWTGAFLALGAPALVALALVLWLDATSESRGRRQRPAPRRSRRRQGPRPNRVPAWCRGRGIPTRRRRRRDPQAGPDLRAGCRPANRPAPPGLAQDPKPPEPPTMRRSTRRTHPHASPNRAPSPWLSVVFGYGPMLPFAGGRRRRLVAGAASPSDDARRRC